MTHLSNRLALTLQESVDVSGVKMTRLREAIADGLIVPRRYGRRVLILRSDLEQFLTALPVAEDLVKSEREVR